MEVVGNSLSVFALPLIRLPAPSPHYYGEKGLGRSAGDPLSPFLTGRG
jgi:hypothetical protein